MGKKHFWSVSLGLVVVVLLTGILLLEEYGVDTYLLASNAERAVSNFVSFGYANTDISDDSVKLKQEQTQKGIIKSIYLTSSSAGSKSKIQYALDIVNNTEINAVVIDIKDYSGYVFYDSNIPEVKKYGSEKIRIADVNYLINEFHKRGAYVIARIAVFQDPVLANARNDIAITKKNQYSAVPPILAGANLWLDNLKLAWVDPASQDAWDYNIAIAKEALEKGFDEVNLDYVRFPSDGNLSNMKFPIWDGKTPRAEVIRNFFKKLREAIPEGRLSIDLFGLTTTNYDDLGVGQIIEYGYESFDYVCPMVYPSHYANGFLGFSNPAKYPYEVVKYSMDRAKERLAAYKKYYETNAELRPWIQDFNMGAVYDYSMVKAEIQASYDSLGSESGYMMWNSSNIYTKNAVK